MLRLSLPEKISELNVFNTHLGICPFSVIQGRALEIMERYDYSKKFGVAPFDGGFDSQPEWWKQAVKIIESEIRKTEASSGGKS